MVTFTARGHPEVRASHPTTLEFTKETRLTRHGDCIVAVGADFDADALRELAKQGGTLVVTIVAEEYKEIITGQANPNFNDMQEVVIRLGEFSSGRTLMVRADKAATHLNRLLVEKLKNPATTVVVTVEKAIE